MSAPCATDPCAALPTPAPCPSQRHAGSKKHGGPVEVLYQLTPVMGVTLLATSLGYEKLWATLPASPYFASVGMALLSLLLIFAGAIIAFAMVGAGWGSVLVCANTCCHCQLLYGLLFEPVQRCATSLRTHPAAQHVLQVVAEFALIANTSALTFMVAGTFKEIVTGGCCLLQCCVPSAVGGDVPSAQLCPQPAAWREESAHPAAHPAACEWVGPPAHPHRPVCLGHLSVQLLLRCCSWERTSRGSTAWACWCSSWECESAGASGLTLLLPPMVVLLLQQVVLLVRTMLLLLMVLLSMELGEGASPQPPPHAAAVYQHPAPPTCTRIHPPPAACCSTTSSSRS